MVTAQPQFTSDSIISICRRVASYRLSMPLHGGWENAPYFSGLLALYEITGNQAYINSATAWSESNNWGPYGSDPHVTNGDNQCCFQVYSELYLLNPTAANRYKIDKAYANFTNMFDRAPLSGRRWAWCDLMFMAPPGIARIAQAANEPRLLDSMNVYWWNSHNLYYSTTNNLYYRDANFIGSTTLWSRGNGWVVAGLARTLDFMPKSYPTRARYEQQLRDMAAKLRTLQGSDGLWRSDLLHPTTYPNPESSGSAFFCFAIAWGINNGILNRAEYEPVVRAAWTGLATCVRSNGALGYVQPPADKPGVANATDINAYGDGAFLLAGREVYRLMTGSAFDTTPPSAPGNLSGAASGQSVISLTWSAAADAESGISRSIIYRGGVQVGQVWGSVTSYADSGLTESTSYSYQVSSVNGAGLEGPKSSAASVSTAADTRPPTVTLVSASSTVRVYFDEPVEQASAQNAANYAIDQGVGISGAVLQADLRSVTLSVSPLAKGVTYTLTVNGILDRAKSPNTIAANTRVTFTVISNITRIRFYPRPGMAARMSGGVFEGTNGDLSSGPYSQLYQIVSAPADGQWTEVTNLTNGDIGYRFVRYRAGGFCNVAEIELYKGAEKATGTPFGTPGSYGNSGSDFRKAFDSDISTYFDYTSDVGGYTGLDMQDAATGTPCRNRSPQTAANLRIDGHRILLPWAGAVTICDARGAVVLRRESASPQSVSLESLAPGAYMVRIGQAVMGAFVKGQ